MAEGNPPSASDVAQDAACVAMGGPQPGAVFISYASQDAKAAGCICEALRRAGIEVWFDQADLRGGDAWAESIRKQIKRCSLFLAVISRITHERAEGYFRLEWKLAIERSHLMAVDRAFILPVAIDETRAEDARVPERFHELHWTRLPDGVVPDSFAAQLRLLLSEKPLRAGHLSVAGVAATHAEPDEERFRRFGSRQAALLIFAIVAAALGYLAVHRRDWSAITPLVKISDKRLAEPAVASVPEKSIGVLPFSDMSESKDQEYFADGMAEEIINLLAKIQGLHVPARTSSFYFKNKSTQLPEIAKALGVANVLEGSVRKSGARLRVTVQLVKVDTGYEVWSETYDRKLDDIFKVQDEIAAAVVSALKGSMFSQALSEPTALQHAGAPLTSSSAAYEAYLRARAIWRTESPDDARAAYVKLGEAVKLDPNFALAWAWMAQLLAYDNAATAIFGPRDPGSKVTQQYGETIARSCDAAREAAGRALQIEPDLATAHAASGKVLASCDWNWQGADVEFRKALELEPNNADALLEAAIVRFAVGQRTEGIELVRRGVSLDPLGRPIVYLAWMQYFNGSLDEAARSNLRTIELSPSGFDVHWGYGLTLLAQGKPAAALSEFQHESSDVFRDCGVPLALEALGRHEEARKAIALAEHYYSQGGAYQIAYFYALTDNADGAFRWLDHAYQQRDQGLEDLKGDPMFKKLRKDPRYTDLLRKIHLPE